MLQFLKPLVPGQVFEYRANIKDKIAFKKLERIACDYGALGRTEDFDPSSVFENPDAAEEWLQVEAELAALRVTDQAGGVNPGDRRALYYLIRALRPRTVLEVGTHVGASTTHITCALRECHGNDGFELTTVDIVDMNDAVEKPWLKLGSTHSPAEMVERLGCKASVRFFAQDSIDFLRQCTEKYDFIFLDGLHAATRVYQEVPAALRLLNPGGYILLHDYFPQLEPLWKGGTMVPGPFLAIRRLQDEGAPLRVLPFGALPWPTKLGSNVTSLALLGRA